MSSEQMALEPDVNERKLKEQATVAEAKVALQKELAKYGLAELLENVKEELVRLQLRRDSFDGSYSFYGEWQANSGAKIGTILIHEGGQVFAEFDVTQPHPTDKRWFVEAVNIWGKKGAMKAELKLLPAL